MWVSNVMVKWVVLLYILDLLDSHLVLETYHCDFYFFIFVGGCDHFLFHSSNSLPLLLN